MIPAKCALTLGSRGYQKKHEIFSHGSGISTFSHYPCDIGKEISPSQGIMSSVLFQLLIGQFR